MDGRGDFTISTARLPHRRCQLQRPALDRPHRGVRGHAHVLEVLLLLRKLGGSRVTHTMPSLSTTTIAITTTTQEMVMAKKVNL